jgi:hypothetical protein
VPEWARYTVIALAAIVLGYRLLVRLRSGGGRIRG